MIPLEVGNLDGLIIIVIGIMVGPPLLLTIIGIACYKRNPKTAKVFFILAAIYLIIGLGICGGMF